MRIGVNPEKDKVIEDDSYHHIIIPIYVPHLEGYFKDALTITKLCIDSVVQTIHKKCKITIVNNGSCKEITTYLQECYQKGMLDQLVHHKKNIGKIDAVIPIAKEANEPLITISDGDVLFKEGWAEAVEKVYRVFPEAGMVSPVPHGTTYYNYTINTLFDAFFKGVLKFQSVCDPKEMLRFAKSIGREDTMYTKKIRLKYQLTVSRKEGSAVVGCGHFVATLRKEVFKNVPAKKSTLAYASEADRDYIDIPNEKAGLWRLATTGNFAYHMGNVPEDWMKEEFIRSEEKQLGLEKPASAVKNKISLALKTFFVKLLMQRNIRPLFFKRIGLKEQADAY